MERAAIPTIDGLVSGVLLRPDGGGRALVACIHGGGCNGGYFELGGPSVADALLARGLDVLLLNRPGTAGNRLADDEDPLGASLRPIRAFIQAVRCEWTGDDRPLGLLGHSIGGALALDLAAEPGGWPLRAVAVSGIGDEAPPAIRAWAPDANQSAHPNADATALFLGPAGTYGWQGLARLRKAAEPWSQREKMQIVQDWPRRWPGVAERVRAPVHLRLADGEKIWATGDAVVRRMAAALTHAPLVDAALLPDGGHLYEIHKRGPELASAQATFLADHLAQPARTERVCDSELSR